jgi:hypothetical protein
MEATGEATERSRARYALGWSGLHCLGLPPSWRECRLINISETGAELEPFDLDRGEQFEGELELELSAPSGILKAVRLRSEIRQVTWSPDGHVSLMIEFAGLTTLEANALELLVPFDAFV